MNPLPNEPSDGRLARGYAASAPRVGLRRRSVRPSAKRSQPRFACERLQVVVGGCIGVHLRFGEFLAGHA